VYRKMILTSRQRMTRAARLESPSAAIATTPACHLSDSTVRGRHPIHHVMTARQVEPPKGLRANMARLYSRHNDLYLNAVRNRPNEWKRLLWAMSMFHGVLQGRATYGALVCARCPASLLPCTHSHGRCKARAARLMALY
jgi:hypothetical protein